MISVTGLLDGTQHERHTTREIQELIPQQKQKRHESDIVTSLQSLKTLRLIVGLIVADDFNRRRHSPIGR